MSLFNTKFENAAKILAESEDEVLQAAGMMALMRMETLKLRLKGVHAGTKALTPWPSTQPRFNFGIPAYPYNTPNSFFAPQFNPNTCFTRPSGTFFGSSKPQNEGVAFGSAPSFVQPSQSGEGSAAPSTLFGSSSQSGFSAAPNNEESNPTSVTFGIPPVTETQLEKS